MSETTGRPVYETTSTPDPYSRRRRHRRGRPGAPVGNGGAAVTTLLTLKHVTCQFGRLAALDRVSLTLPRGQRHALIGPNGDPGG